jgi:hypothetical protein
MPLSRGEKLGLYQILASIDKGGHAAQAKLFESTIEFDKIDWFNSDAGKLALSPM